MKNIFRILICLLIIIITTNANAQEENNQTTFTKVFKLNPDWFQNFSDISLTKDGRYVAAYQEYQMFDNRRIFMIIDSMGNLLHHVYYDSLIMQNYNIPCIDCMLGGVGTNGIDLHAMTAHTRIPHDEILDLDPDFSGGIYLHNASIALFNNEGENLWTKILYKDPNSISSINNYPNNVLTSLYEDAYITSSNEIVGVGGFQSNCVEQEFTKVIGYVIKLDTAGNILWEWADCKDSTSNHEESYFFAVKEDSNGDIVACGTALIPSFSMFQEGCNCTVVFLTYTGLLVKLDKNGNLIFRKEWGFPEYSCMFRDLAILPNGNLALAASAQDTSQNGMTDQCQLLLITDTNGELIAKSTFIPGGSFNGNLPPRCALGGDTCIYVLHQSAHNFKFVLRKHNSLGDLLNYVVLLDTTYMQPSSSHAITSHPNGGATIGFQFVKADFSEDGAFLIRVDADLNGNYPRGEFLYPDSVFHEYVTYHTTNQIETPKHTKVYPNPTNGEIYVDLPKHCLNAVCRLYSSQGVLVKEISLKPYENIISLSDFHNGIYILQINCNDEIITKKIIIQN